MRASLHGAHFMEPSVPSKIETLICDIIFILLC